jgi:hypothetical protein
MINDGIIFFFSFFFGYYLRPIIDIIFDVIAAIYANAQRNYKASKVKGEPKLNSEKAMKIALDSIKEDMLNDTTLRTNNTNPKIHNVKPVIKYKNNNE